MRAYMLELVGSFVVAVISGVIVLLLGKFIDDRNRKFNGKSNNSDIQQQQNIIVNQTTSNNTHNYYAPRNNSASDSSSEKFFLILLAIILICFLRIVIFRIPSLIFISLGVLFCLIKWLASKNQPLEDSNKKNLLNHNTFLFISFLLAFIFLLNLFAPTAFLAFLQKTSSIPLRPILVFLKGIFNHIVLAAKEDFTVFAYEIAIYSIFQVAGFFLLCLFLLLEIRSLHKNEISLLEHNPKQSWIFLIFITLFVSGLAYKICTLFVQIFHQQFS